MLLPFGRLEIGQSPIFGGHSRFLCHFWAGCANFPTFGARGGVSYFSRVQAILGVIQFLYLNSNHLKSE